MTVLHSLFNLLKILLSGAACRAYPVCLKLLERCSRRNATIRISKGWIIYPAAWLA